MTRKRNNKQTRNRGDIVKIDLGDGFFGYGIVWGSPLVSFFDIKEEEDLSIDNISKSNILFSVWVMDYAITGGEWPIIGNVDVGEDFNEYPAFFKIDRGSGKFFLTYTGDEEEPSCIEDIQGMERAAVWDPEHVVDRLNDYYNGRPNVWVEQLKAPTVE